MNWLDNSIIKTVLFRGNQDKISKYLKRTQYYKFSKIYLVNLNKKWYLGPVHTFRIGINTLRYRSGFCIGSIRNVWTGPKCSSGYRSSRKYIQINQLVSRNLFISEDNMNTHFEWSVLCVFQCASAALTNSYTNVCYLNSAR